MERLRKKSILLTGYLEYLLHSFINEEQLTILTPLDENQRGCQLSLFFKNGIVDVFEKLGSAGVICDIRKPNVIRVAPCPLYNSFSDVFEFCCLLKEYLN